MLFIIFRAEAEHNPYQGIIDLSIMHDLHDDGSPGPRFRYKTVVSIATTGQDVSSCFGFGFNLGEFILLVKKKKR